MSEELDNDESRRETRRHDAVLTHNDLKRIEKSIDSLREDMREDFNSLLSAVKELNTRHAAIDVWKATIDMRLAQGVDRMNGLSEDVKGCVEKKVVIAYLAGASMGSAGLTALVMKALGSG